MIKYLFFIIIFFPNLILSQNGMTFDELKDKVSKYFDESLINDVLADLPSGDNYRIWGWDVGDFSGDGYYDLSFAVRKFGVGNKKVDVYLFCDIEGYLVNVAKYEKDFFEIPLEVGIVIKNNVCYITQKEKLYHWNIEGFTFDNGNIILVDKFETEKLTNYTKETYKNFLELKSKEKYIDTKSGNTKYEVEFLTIPSYPRGNVIYKGFNNSAFIYDIDYVIKGAYDWQGEKDASFFASSAYDDEFLYLTIDVKDDKLVVPSCEECTSDYIDIWFNIDNINSKNLISSKNKQLVYANNLDSIFYKFSLYLGDFAEEKSYVTLSSNKDIPKDVKANVSKIKSVALENEGGYLTKLKIPFNLLGIDSVNKKNAEGLELSCTIIVNDIDDEFKPDKKTEIASSKFKAMEPRYFGRIIFISEKNWYGKSENIYNNKILNYLKEYGL